MADASAKNKILVLGRPTAGKASLVGKVVNTAAAAAAAEAPNEQSAKVEWQITTRYYQAAVEFWIDSTEQLAESHVEFMKQWLLEPYSHSDDEAENESAGKKLERAIPAEESMEQLQEHLSEVTDAIVFVFDPAEPETFYDILPWARYSRKYRPGVLLCVAAKGENGSKEADTVAVDSLKDSWFSWCVANGWEWVDLTDTDPDTEYTVDRIREALVSNEWPCMIAKDGTHSEPPLLIKGEVGGEDVSAAELRPEGVKEQEEWDQFDAVAQSLDQGRVDALHRSLFGSKPSGSGSSSGGPSLGDNGEDDDADSVAAVLSKLSVMRSEISRMDPEQARVKAAELAMAVARRL